MLAMFEAGEFDVVLDRLQPLQSAITQIVTVQQLIPFAPPASGRCRRAPAGGAIYEFEPDEEEILAELLPRNLARADLHARCSRMRASEQGARMTAMDNATRNAGDMIDQLTLNYNRTRQAAITKELIEIISGAEAL